MVQEVVDICNPHSWTHGQVSAVYFYLLFFFFFVFFIFSYFIFYTPFLGAPTPFAPLVTQTHNLQIGSEGWLSSEQFPLVQVSAVHFKEFQRVEQCCKASSIFTSMIICLGIIVPIFFPNKIRGGIIRWELNPHLQGERDRKSVV